MKISVRVKPNAGRNDVKKLAENEFIVSVTAPPVEGKANEKLVAVLSEYFHKPKRNIVIVRGATARRKIVEIQ
jgi:uncharacterized protein (TIGR00251 family)